MKLYYSKGACSLAARIIIHELALPCEYIAVNLKTKITENGENYLTINPKGAVPALQSSEDYVLTENAVIQQYLADKHQTKDLLPPIDDFKRYQVLEWLNFIATDIHKGFGPLHNPKVPDTYKNEFVIPQIKSKLNFIDHALENKQYLAGEKFTLPDAYLFVMLLWSQHFHFDLNEFSNLARYFENLKKRKSIIDALAEEQIALTK